MVVFGFTVVDVELLPDVVGVVVFPFLVGAVVVVELGLVVPELPVSCRMVCKSFSILVMSF